MKKDYGPARFVEIVFLILTVLSLGLALLTILLTITTKNTGMLSRLVPSILAAAVFYGLYVMVNLLSDTNEKINALWRSRETPPPPEIPRCREPGCNEPIYSSSTGLCRSHFVKTHPEQKDEVTPA